MTPTQISDAIFAACLVLGGMNAGGWGYLWWQRRQIEKAHRAHKRQMDAQTLRLIEAQAQADAEQPLSSRAPPVFTDILGRRDPSGIPDGAASVRWEACHLWSPYVPKPSRHRWGVDCPEPPLAMACPECDLRQPAMHPGSHRVCRYCGAEMQVHGTRVYFWRTGAEPVIASPWRPE